MSRSIMSHIKTKYMRWGCLMARCVHCKLFVWSVLESMQLIRNAHMYTRFVLHAKRCTFRKEWPWYYRLLAETGGVFQWANLIADSYRDMRFLWMRAYWKKGIVHARASHRTIEGCLNKCLNICDNIICGAMLILEGCLNNCLNTCANIICGSVSLGVLDLDYRCVLLKNSRKRTFFIGIYI